MQTSANSLSHLSISRVGGFCHELQISKELALRDILLAPRDILLAPNTFELRLRKKKLRLRKKKLRLRKKKVRLREKKLRLADFVFQRRPICKMPSLGTKLRILVQAFKAWTQSRLKHYACVCYSFSNTYVGHSAEP